MAVYTKVSADEAAGFLAAYDLGTLRDLAGIRQGVENTNYFVTTTTGRYVLTLYEKRTRREDLPFFVGLMEHLGHQGIPCPLPVQGKDGQALRELNDRPAALVSFLEGKMPERITPEICAEVGRGLARLHQAGKTFEKKRDNSVGLPAWLDLFAACKNRADDVMAGLSALIDSELSFLQQNWPRALPQGVIHADLFPDNVFFGDDKLCGIIDFYFACTDALAYDLVITLNAWCFERSVAFNLTKAHALIKGYESVRPLSKTEREALPILARGAAMRFLLTRLYDWLHQVEGALVKAKDPLEYLTRLQFHQHVANVTSYGFEG